MIFATLMDPQVPFKINIHSNKMLHFSYPNSLWWTKKSISKSNNKESLSKKKVQHSHDYNKTIDNKRHTESNRSETEDKQIGESYETLSWRKRRPRMAREDKRTMRTSEKRERRVAFRLAQWWYTSVPLISNPIAFPISPISESYWFRHRSLVFFHIKQWNSDEFWFAGLTSVHIWFDG